MRLTSAQIDIIKSATRSVLGDGARVVLFGSRVNDQLKGGDIDLLVELDTPVASKPRRSVTSTPSLFANWVTEIDILIKDGMAQTAAAKQTGVILRAHKPIFQRTPRLLALELARLKRPSTFATNTPPCFSCE